MLNKYSDTLRLIRNTISKDYFLDKLHYRRRPKTLQLYISSRCNSCCASCNIWKQDEQNEIDAMQLEKVLFDSFFEKVTIVDFHGGEITMVSSFFKCLDAILTLKSLKIIKISSNGFEPDKLLSLLSASQEVCRKHNVKLYFTLYVNGYKNIHEEFIGVPGCFLNTQIVLSELKSHPSKYADKIYISSTLSKQNIAFVCQTEEYLKKFPFEINYRVAVPNKRDYTDGQDDTFSILHDKYSLMLATEFFYERYRDFKQNRFKNYCYYFFLKNKGKGRLCQCSFLYRDVTIDENLNLYLCEASNSIGNLNNDSATNLAFSRTMIERTLNQYAHCSKCTHNISVLPTFTGLFSYLLFKIKHLSDWVYKFEFLAR